MARTVLIKRGTHLPPSLALRWLTEPHDSTGREDRGEEKHSHLAAAEIIRAAGRNRRKGVTSRRTRGIFRADFSESTFSAGRN